MRGRVCAIQQSSIFIRVSIARLINEVARGWPGSRGWPRGGPGWRGCCGRSSSSCFRRSQICLGHNQFVRLDTLRALGGFPTSGATEDSTLGYALGARGILIGALPMLELVDLPETTDKMVRQNARWYKGVLDDVRFLARTWRRGADRVQPGPARPARRQQGAWSGRSPRWSIPSSASSAGTSPIASPITRVLFVLAIAFPSISLGLTIWVGGIVTQDLIESLTPYLPEARERRPHHAGGEVLGDVPLPDLLAAGDPRRLAGAARARPHRPLRAGQDRSRRPRPRHRQTLALRGPLTTLEASPP